MKHKITQSRVFRIALGWLVVFLIFFIPYLIKNGISDELSSNWYNAVGLIALWIIIYYAAIYTGLLIMKLMYGWDYKYDGPTGRWDLRFTFGAGVFVIIFYICMYIYKFLK
ncbi:MAG: hypothetical protein J0M18_20430 [Ignavibacteria bacterium]|nr:hypothetical protein [Ignavibacteria bacterium]